MTVDQVVLNTYLAATGKATPPVVGTAKYTKILAYMNMFTQIWALESDVDWASLRTLFPVVATVSATDTFLIPATCGKVSSQEGDFVRIAHTNGTSESDYTIVPAGRLYDDGPKVSAPGITKRNSVGTCAVIGPNLVFSRAFLSTDPQFGGTIRIPGYSIPATLTTGTDTTVVDDPWYLVFRIAAEYVLTDVTRVQLRPALLDQATDRMDSMKEKNDSQSETVYAGAWSPLGESWL